MNERLLKIYAAIISLGVFMTMISKNPTYTVISVLTTIPIIIIDIFSTKEVEKDGDRNSTRIWNEK